MEPEEVRLRIFESVMRYKGLLNLNDIMAVCKDVENYVFNLDKASLAPSDDEKRSLPRRALKAKDAPSNF